MQANPLPLAEPAPKVFWLVVLTASFLVTHAVTGAVWLRASASEAATPSHEALFSSPLD